MSKLARKIATRAKKPRKTVQFLHKPACATCRFFIVAGGRAAIGYDENRMIQF